MLYKLLINKMSKYKIVKYLKIFLNQKCILLITIASIFSNTYIIYINSMYDNFYKNTPNLIHTEAVVVRRL